MASILHERNAPLSANHTFVTNRFDLLTNARHIYLLGRKADNENKAPKVLARKRTNLQFN